MEEQINLVDGNGNRLGGIGKLPAHEQGLLHEAFSIFVFNEKDEVLLQRRALTKYHSGGLWTNTCCGHPRVGEELSASAHRRLGEEMGFDCGLTELYAFTYKVHITEGSLTEHEYDHVLVGQVSSGDIALIPNPEEVCEYRWMDIGDLLADASLHPEHYTTWFKIILSDHDLHQLRDGVHIQ